MTLRVMTAPAYEPVSEAEFLAWARIDAADAQAAVAATLIKACREYAENLTGRAFIPRDLQLVLPDWQGGCIELPQPPLIEVTSITYLDVDGIQQTLAADQYVVHSEQEPGIIVPEWMIAWPVLRGTIDSVRVNYRAGYSTQESPDDESAYQAALPASLRLWLQARAATMNEYREQLMMNSRIKLPRDFADSYLDSLTVGSRLF